MLEPIIATIGMLGLFLALSMINDADDSFGKYAGYAIFGIAGLYLLVRFVHWCWITPIPFTR